MSGRRTNAFRGSMTYFTGTHNLKVGVNGTTFREGNTSNTSMQNWTNAISVAGFPLQAQFWLPNLALNNGAAWGIYVQDHMTFDRLTVNAGLRYDRLGNAYPDQFRGPSTWEPEGLSIPGNESVVGWHDLQPRIGVAYDLFGDGKTALKASANRYGTRSNSEWSALLNPGSAVPLRNQLRLWIDGAPAHFAVPGPPTGFPSCIGPVACVAGDGLVQGDPLNPAPNGELLSPNANLAFGSLQQINFLDPDWSHGWSNRLSNWEITAGVQQELAGGVSLDVTYFRRNFVNFALQDDRMLAASDYDLAAVDLSGLGIAGVGTVTFPELKPEALGRVPDVLFTSANDFGGEEQVFNGVDVTINARLDTLLLQGGLATGATATNFCPAYDAAPEHLGRRHAAVDPRPGAAGPDHRPVDGGRGGARPAVCNRSGAGPQRPAARDGVRRALQPVRPAVHEDHPDGRDSPAGDVRHLQPVQRQRRVLGVVRPEQLPDAHRLHAAAAVQVRVPARLLMRDRR